MTLSREEIVDRIRPNLRAPDESIVVTPLLDISDQIGVCGVDVRLGKQFVLFNEHTQDTLDPADESPFAELQKYQEEIVVPIGRSLILHPHKLIIGCTFEYVSIPDDLECQVEGRSSWARLGLMIATATTIEPGYKGVITLELSNTGNIPIRLYPGLKVAQIIFHTVSKARKLSKVEIEEKKYQFSIGPQLSRVYKDKSRGYFTTLSNRPKRNYS